METKFYKCPICGNVIVKFTDSGVVPFCCGKQMELLVPQTSEKDAGEKHLPVMMVIESGILQVEIGSVPHPSTEYHYIEWIYLETEKGGQLVYLHPNDRPMALFCCKGRPTAVYAYCNQHGLWRSEMNYLPSEDFYC
ncbi:MAG: desulfoferrodoxin [Paludibacteraceae bacterium]|nr:desulfoferrodoxin [Paludibacteraceae bacterium]